MEKTWIIREARLEDKDGIQAFHQDLFGWAMDDAAFNRLCQDNPAGEACIWVAEETRTGQIAGSIVFIPCKMMVADKVMMGSQAEYWAVAPEYRRQGLLLDLHRQAARGMRQKGIPITYYFAPLAWAGYISRQNAVQSFVIGHMRWLARPLDIRPILSKIPAYMAKKGRRARRERSNIILQWLLRNKVVSTILGWVANIGLRCFYLAKSIGKGKGNLICREIESFDARFDELWEKLAEAYRVAIVRNRDYLNWRYSHHPSRHYRILCAESDGELKGYIVLFPGKLVRIMDLLATDGKTADFLIRSTVTYASRQKSAVVAVRLPERNRHLHTFRKSGFYLVPERLSPRGLLGFWPNSEFEEIELLKDLGNWFMMEGDWDWIEPAQAQQTP